MSNKKILVNQEKNTQVVHFDTSYNIINPKNKGIDIVFQNISYSVQIPDDTQKSILPCKTVYKEKQILKNVSGIFKAGHCTAIMGASGAGKTTLLNILSCRINPSEGGKLYANSFQYQYQHFGNFANYVMQSDILMQTLTVRQTLLFAAQLKTNDNEQERKQKITRLAHQLKLQKCLDTLVGGVVLKGVSGGERKRVSIAFQLISDPQVLFLDEPTSGLDSLTSYIIVNQLNKLAKKDNKTIIMTIHQPNSQIYEIFDNLLLLLDGRIIYQGKASQITGYFQKKFQLTCPEFMNPADFFMSKIHYDDQRNRKLYPAYFQSYQKNQKQIVNTMILQKQTSQFQQRVSQNGFWSAIPPLMERNFKNTIRNPMLMKSKLFQGIFLALFTGGMYFNIGTRDYTNTEYWYSITGFLFFLTITGMMQVLAPISLTFPSERQVFFREQDSRMYGVGQYFLARNLVEIPQLVIIPLIVVSIYYFMVGLAHTGQQFFLHYFIYFLSGFTGGSLGLFIGSVILDGKSVSNVIPIVILPVILFSGFFKNRANLPVWIGWIEYISPNKYSFIAHVGNETAYKSSLINNLNFDINKGQAIGILVALGMGLRLLSAFFLWYMKKRSQ